MRSFTVCKDRSLEREGGVAAFRVSFSRILMGVGFPVASIQIRHARDADRAVRAATLRLAHRYGLPDWRVRADAVNVEPEGAA
jgi:hypothetical protein